MPHTYRIQNIRCGGCANTIRRKLGEAGFEVLDVRPEDHAVVVSEAGAERVAAGAAILKALGYPLVDQDSGAGDFARSVVSCAIGRFGPA